MLIQNQILDHPTLGATQVDDGRWWQFLVWAPKAAKISLRLHGSGLKVPMAKDNRGYHSVSLPDLLPEERYTFILDGNIERPDPASRFQPNGVHGPSALVSNDFEWAEATWFGLPLRDYIIYELHVGTFTPEGTFEAIIKRLPELQKLGITAVELMPIAQFPGARNWGYDGAYPFAPQNTYGGPNALKRLVEAAHGAGLAIILDVVYNHFGPEGNYLREFGPYFTPRYQTPWGEALNFDGEHSDEVRRFFIENALYWQTDFRIDALRLDAVHAIHDESATPFLAELARATSARSTHLNRRFHLIAESDLNDVRLILPERLYGRGINAQWSDDFHHCLHVLVTGEQDGYYADFTAGVQQFSKILSKGFAYTGEYSRFRKRCHGNDPAAVLPEQLVVYAQNHDQIGNRMLGERLAQLTSFEALKLVAASVLLSPYTPLLFMGEEWGEQSPFQYFISHSDAELVEAVRKGRQEEFAAFGWNEKVPDPGTENTFISCVVDQARYDECHTQLREFYRELIAIRKQLSPSIQGRRRDLTVHCYEKDQTIVMEYANGEPLLLVVLCFSIESVTISWPQSEWTWKRKLDSAAKEWFGPGTYSPEGISAGSRTPISIQPRSAVVFIRTDEGSRQIEEAGHLIQKD